MSMNITVIVNVILNLAALAPILLLATWGIRTGHEAHAGFGRESAPA